MRVRVQYASALDVTSISSSLIVGCRSLVSITSISSSLIVGYGSLVSRGAAIA